MPSDNNMAVRLFVFIHMNNYEPLKPLTNVTAVWAQLIFFLVQTLYKHVLS